MIICRKKFSLARAGLLYELAMPATEQLSAILPAGITHIAGMARSYRCFTSLKDTIFRRISLYELSSCTSRPHVGAASCTSWPNVEAGLLYELAMPATEQLSTILPAGITHIAGMARSYSQRRTLLIYRR